MKRYIVTNSLNIDNILSTESISPINVYTHRKFGYQSFVELEFDIPHNYLLLFSVVPSYYIDDSYREQFPLIIEVDDDKQLNSAIPIAEYSGISVYGLNNTILLSPENCRLLFFSSKAATWTRNNSQDSKLNKWGEYYQFDVIKPSDISLEKLLSSIHIPESISSNSRIDENKYDRVKGFIYGYYLGMLKSLPSDIARLQTMQKRIYDIIASVKSNKGEINTTFINELKQLDLEYTKLDPIAIQASNTWAESLNKHGLTDSQLTPWLRENDMEGIVKSKFMENHGLRIRRRLHDFDILSLDAFNKDIENHTKALIRDSKNSNIRLDDVIISSDYSSVELNREDNDTKMFNCIIQSLLWEGLFKDCEYLRLNKGDIAYESTKRVVSIFKEMNKNWDNSKERLYFHHLRQNLSEFSPFDLNEIDSIVFQSLAAFILKGEDYDDLTTYLTNQSLPTYQYALALWGGTCGYVQLSRTILENGLSKIERETLYKTIYSKLWSKEYSAKMINQSRYEFTQVNVPTSAEDSQSSRAVGTLRETIEGLVGQFIEQEKSRTKITDKDKLIIKECIEISNENQKTFISHLGSRMRKNKKIYKFLFNELSLISEKVNIKEEQVSLFDPNNISESSTVAGTNQYNIFTGQSSSDFNKNTCEVLANNGCDIIRFVDKFLANQKQEIKNTILALFKWFIQEYTSGYYATNIANYPKNNKSIIEHFGNVFFSDTAIKQFNRSNLSHNVTSYILLNHKYQPLINELVSYLKLQYDR